MQIGSVIIAGDLLGFVTDIGNESVSVKSADGVVRTVNKSACTEVVSGYALAALYYTKLVKKANESKNKNM